MQVQELPKGVNPDSVVLVDGIYYDLCVLCRKNSNVPTDCPVAERSHYVEGCGQLCGVCWDRTESVT